MASENMQLLCVYHPDATDIAEVMQNVFKSGVDVEKLADDKPFYFSWKIENKYFVADVDVCCCPDHLFDKLAFNGDNEVEAALLVSNMNDTNSIVNVKAIISKLADRSIETCLLYSMEIVSDEDVKDEVFSYCLDNSFEFVERSVDNYNEDDGLQEKLGLDRIIEALHSHLWSNHVMKNKAASSQSAEGIDELNQMFHGDSSFNELFGKFMSMKEKAKSLGDEERKAYAEKVALAFMDALGIDEEDEDE